MVMLTIDRQIIHIARETSVLEAARKLNIYIPTLCHHKALRPYGSCRLCTVEVIKNNQSKLVTSCNYPVEEGLEVLTSSDRVKSARKVYMELLLARCPDVSVIQKLAHSMGVKTSRFYRKGNEKCILCGLCVRVCDEMVGVRAIDFVNRGTDREVNTPFETASDVCIGCGACTYICPTSCIEMVGKPGNPYNRHLNMGELDLNICQNNYRCDTCDVDHQFLDEMRRVIEDVCQKNAKRDSQG